MSVGRERGRRGVLLIVLSTCVTAAMAIAGCTAHLSSSSASHRFTGHRFDVKWSPVSQLDSHALVTGLGFRSVSCSPQGGCTALEESGQAIGLVGRRWGELERVGATDIFSAISCPSENFCVALGSAGAGTLAAYEKGPAARWRLITRFGHLGDAILWVLSCGSRAFCLAGGSLGVTYRFDGRHWAPANQGSSPADSEDAVSAISCPTANECFAGSETGYVYVYRKGRWVSSKRVDEARYGIVDLSCASTASCIAVDHQGRAVRYQHGHWFPPRFVDPGHHAFAAISCVRSTLCVAVDFLGRVLSFDGARWSSPVLVDRPLKETGDWAVSCSASKCVLVDTSGRASIGNVSPVDVVG